MTNGHTRLLGAVALGAWAIASVLSAQGTAPARTVNDGVYTAAQAARGSSIFAAQCTMCHETSRFTGETFVGHWSGKPLADLFLAVSTTMPEDNPGSLKPQDYGDLVAYFLQLNGYPAGSEELAGTLEAMRVVTMAPRP